MKTAMLFGYGKMGRTTAVFLQKLGYDVIAIDTPLAVSREKFSSDWRYILKDLLPSDTEDKNEYYINRYYPHLVISTLPYTENLQLAKCCIKNGISYCDLGGKVSNTEEIKTLAENKNVAVATDLGLAPGLINIFTEAILKNKKPRDAANILCAVGGIPVLPSDQPFNYYCTWSIDGLINEYIDKCLYLKNGKQEYIEGLRDLEHVQINKLGRRLECFTTSGASAHSVPRLQQLGFRDFIYKTLRYSGHRNFIRTIIDESGLPNLPSIIKRLSDSAPINDDMVVGLLRYDDKNGIEQQHEFIVYGNEDWTAMQIATAAPLSVIASMIMDGHLPNRYLTYSDILPHFTYFKLKLKELGVEL